MRIPTARIGGSRPWSTPPGGPPRPTRSSEALAFRLLSRTGGESVIVFTEYRDTLRQLAGVLPAALHLHGGLTSAERAGVQRRFNEHGGVLLATDAAADGLNLQRRCRLIVNYELPWNPARLEQRIGRVDRIGQRRRVHAITLVARDTAEDLVVAKLARRLARVAATLGERDRLATFLTDARTARAVIAGTPQEIEDTAPPAPQPSRAGATDFPVERVAERLARGVHEPAGAKTTAIAAMRASSLLQPGWVAIVRAAVTTDRGVVAERPFIFHVAADAVPRPATHHVAREMGRVPIAIAEAAARADPTVCQWRDEIQATHDRAARLRIAREESLRGGDPGERSTQPGLFDDRALRDASRLAAHDERRREEHERHIRALDEGRFLRLECAVDALLIVWR